jgi:hypothetical protein
MLQTFNGTKLLECKTSEEIVKTINIDMNKYINEVKHLKQKREKQKIRPPTQIFEQFFGKRRNSTGKRKSTGKRNSTSKRKFTSKRKSTIKRKHSF